MTSKSSLVASSRPLCAAIFTSTTSIGSVSGCVVVRLELLEGQRCADGCKGVGFSSQWFIGIKNRRAWVRHCGRPLALNEGLQLFRAVPCVGDIHHVEREHLAGSAYISVTGPQGHDEGCSYFPLWWFGYGSLLVSESDFQCIPLVWCLSEEGVACDFLVQHGI